MAKKILVVEESLRDLKAHWFEYIKTIGLAAEQQAWEVDVACHKNAVAEISQTFRSSFPIFRHARYLDNNALLPGDRYYGFILHSWRCLRVLWPLLSKQPRYDEIFAPTVLVHHLLAWWILMTIHPKKPRHLTLFFVTNPGAWDASNQRGIIAPGFSTKLQGQLLNMFGQLVEKGKVCLAVETQGAQQEFESLAHLPFRLMPHPVFSLADRRGEKSIASSVSSHIPSFCIDSLPSPECSTLLKFACYGFARYEKGSDLLKAAIEELLEQDIEISRKEDKSSITFCVQWVDPFLMPDGSECSAQSLTRHSEVQLIERPLASEEYQLALSQTSCMLLPYRNSSYHARLSRIAIESVTLGIPIIYTKGGWLQEIVEAFGAGIGIRDESVEDLVDAIVQMKIDYKCLRQKAMVNRKEAQQYFSGETFCQQLFQKSYSVS